jgi:predicted dehydrogenase
VEKPFMPTTNEADQIIQLAEQVNRKVFVYQNRRWDGDFLTIQKLLKSKLLGTVEYYEAHFDRYSPQRTRAAWRDEPLPGSGNLFDLGSHLIDQVFYLFGNPRSISADIQSQRPGSMVDDFFEIRMNYPEMQALVTAGMLEENAELRYIINGTKGSYVKYGIDPQEALLKEGIKPDADDWGMEGFDNWGLASFVQHELFFEGAIETEPGNYMGFYQNVHDVLTAGAEMAVKPEEARNVIRIIEMALESAENHQELVYKDNLP